MEKQLNHLLINKNPDLDEIRKLCQDHRPFLDELVYKGLLKGDALLAFVELWDLLNPATKKKVVNFAKDLLKSESPKTKKEAKNFLKKYNS